MHLLLSFLLVVDRHFFYIGVISASLGISGQKLFFFSRYSLKLKENCEYISLQTSFGAHTRMSEDPMVFLILVLKVLFCTQRW